MSELKIPQGYKKTEIGVIPEDWACDSLESVCPKGRKYCIVDGPFGSNLKTEHYRKSGIPIITSGFVTDGTFQVDNYLFVDEEKFRQEKRSAVNPSDIVMAKIGARCGASAILPKEHVVGILSGNALKITVDESKHHTYFIWQLLWDLYTKGSLDDITTTGAQPAISMSSLKKYLIPLPPINEQTAIATALSDIDTLISELEKLIAKKQAIKTATMQQLLIGRTRLPQFAHHPDGRKKGYKPSELGEIPEDWKVVQINQCTDLITKGTTPMTIGKAFVPQGITFVKVESINESGQLDFTKFAYIDEETDKLLARSRIKENDLLISIAGALGRAAIVKHEILPANTNQALAIVRLNKDSEISLNFLYHFTKTTLFKKCIDEIASQGAQPNLSLGDLGAFKIVAPNLKEQKIISDMLSDMDEEIQALEQRLGKTRQIKQGMMQELLTGKTRLIKPSKEVIHE